MMKKMKFAQKMDGEMYCRVNRWDVVPNAKGLPWSCRPPNNVLDSCVEVWSIPLLLLLLLLLRPGRIGKREKTRLRAEEMKDGRQRWCYVLPLHGI